MGFESGLVARQVGDVDWELVEPLMYRGNTELFKVPIETKTDFASVPSFLQWLIPRSGWYTRAAVLHDYLWRSVSGVSYKDADGIFRRATFGEVFPGSATKMPTGSSDGPWPN
jgi:hypothetical protein